MALKLVIAGAAGVLAGVAVAVGVMAGGSGDPGQVRIQPAGVSEDVAEQVEPRPKVTAEAVVDESASAPAVAAVNPPVAAVVEPEPAKTAQRPASAASTQEPGTVGDVGDIEPVTGRTIVAPPANPGEPPVLADPPGGVLPVPPCVAGGQWNDPACTDG